MIKDTKYAKNAQLVAKTGFMQSIALLFYQYHALFENNLLDFIVPLQKSN